MYFPLKWSLFQAGYPASPESWHYFFPHLAKLSAASRSPATACGKKMRQPLKVQSHQNTTFPQVMLLWMNGLETLYSARLRKLPIQVFFNCSVPLESAKASWTFLKVCILECGFHLRKKTQWRVETLFRKGLPSNKRWTFSFTSHQKPCQRSQPQVLIEASYGLDCLEKLAPTNGRSCITNTHTKKHSHLALQASSSVCEFELQLPTIWHRKVLRLVTISCAFHELKMSQLASQRASE